MTALNLSCSGPTYPLRVGPTNESSGVEKHIGKSPGQTAFRRKLSTAQKRPQLGGAGALLSPWKGMSGEAATCAQLEPEIYRYGSGYAETA